MGTAEYRMPIEYTPNAQRKPREHLLKAQKKLVHGPNERIGEACISM